MSEQDRSGLDPSASGQLGAPSDDEKAAGEAVHERGPGDVLSDLLRHAAARRVLADPVAGDERRQNARRTLGLPECSYCERNIEEGFGPRHNPSSRCESGGRPHCTCDVCF